MASLSGRTAVVTGASRGIGAGIASALARQGARVVILARDEARLREQAARIPGSISLTCDVSDATNVESVSRRIVSELGGAPDILVNNAGLFRVAPVEETTAESFAETINTDLVGPFLFVRAFLGDMKKRKDGHIVTIGSIADRTIYTGNAAYSAAKFGLRALHEVMRAELRGSGVRATLVSPGLTDTAIWDSVPTDEPGSRFPTRGEMLKPDDVVAAVMFAVTQPDRVNIDELRLSRS